MENDFLIRAALLNLDGQLAEQAPSWSGYNRDGGNGAATMHVPPSEIADILDLPGMNTLLGLAEVCERGLPVESLHRLAQAMSSNEQAFLDCFFSRSTLRRRHQGGKLTPDESDRVVRLASTWLMARDTFGDEAKAHRFLHQEHALLGGRRPFDLARASGPGAKAVEQVLGRLRYGTAA